MGAQEGREEHLAQVALRERCPRERRVELQVFIARTATLFATLFVCALSLIAEKL